jgi:hypothetical protein
MEVLFTKKCCPWPSVIFCFENEVMFISENIFPEIPVDKKQKAHKMSKIPSGEIFH